MGAVVALPYASATGCSMDAETVPSWETLLGSVLECGADDRDVGRPLDGLQGPSRSIFKGDVGISVGATSTDAEGLKGGGWREPKEFWEKRGGFLVASRGARGGGEGSAVEG